MNFNHEELMLMMLYNSGTRLGLVHELRLMQCYLMPDETALRELSESVIEKLKLLTDAEFAGLVNWNFPRTDFCRLRAAYIVFFFFGKYFKPVQFRGRLIRIQNVATKTGCTPRQRHTIRRGDILL